MKNQDTQSDSGATSLPPLTHILYYLLNAVVIFSLFYFLAIPATMKVILKAEGASLSPEAQQMLQESHIPMYVETESRLKTNRDFEVVINLNSINRQLDEVDVIVDYNPEYVEWYPGALKGTARFPEIYNVHQPHVGQITFSARASRDHAFTGEDEVARLSFKTIKEGNTTILIQHNAGKPSQNTAVPNFDSALHTIALHLEIGEEL